MTTPTDLVRELVPPGAQYSGTGWYNFNCPFCGDKRMRGGLLFTEDDGFKYYCFNGGCDYNVQPTGWSPELEFFGGRAKEFYRQLGGDLRRIPLEYMMRRGGRTTGRKGEEKPPEVTWKFDEVDLPRGSELLVDAAKEHGDALDVLSYLKKRGVPPEKIREFPFIWTPVYRHHLIIPYVHYDSIVGYVGRSILKEGSGEDRFIQRSASDYVFNQHMLRTYGAKYVFVVEAPLDAISLECLAVRNDRMTKKQETLLATSHKGIILIPDLKKGEWKGFFETAKKHNWYLSIPDWGRGVTDVQESVAKNGLLYTTECVMKGITRNYKKAEILLRTRNT